MHSANVYSSSEAQCGLFAFSSHLQHALRPFGINLEISNLRVETTGALPALAILHYVPSGFAMPGSTELLASALSSRPADGRLIVVLHGLHGPGEDRFLQDTLCPEQAQQVAVLLQHADSFVALSGSVAATCREWRSLHHSKTPIIQLNHPGLYVTPSALGTRAAEPYVLLAGISRSKKRHLGAPISGLLSACATAQIRVWSHWTNVVHFGASQSWRTTSGYLPDEQWSDLLSNASVVLCPYDTRIQSVSGVVSESLSAGVSVLSTAFDLAVEMQTLVPERVIVDNCLARWPQRLTTLLGTGRGSWPAVVPSWPQFASAFAGVLKDGSTYAS